MCSEAQRHLAIHHIVHEYANFVSSAEMVIHGRDVAGEYFKPPINTHISHAFYLNCRKLADFFQNKASRDHDDILAKHFVLDYAATLPVFEVWRRPINKQLAHVTYARDVDATEITGDALNALYDEFKRTWREFRHRLPELYAMEFIRQVRERKAPYPNGEPSEFRFYDLE